MNDEMQTCTACGETLDMSAFVKSKAFAGGYSKDCKACRAKGKPPKPAITLIGSEIAVLRLLRNHAGMTGREIERRIGYAVQRLPRLITLGLVQKDAQLFHSLTDAGRAAAPYRNKFLEDRRKQMLKQAEKCQVDHPKQGENVRGPGVAPTFKTTDLGIHP